MKRILVIDDEISILKVMKLVLEKRGYHVTDCFGPEEAIYKLKNEKFDLMITDLRLNHRVDGLEMVERAKLLHPRLPIIIMTAYASVNVAVEAMKSGVYDFVTKPFKMDNFLEIIENGVKNKTYHVTPSESDLPPDVHFDALVGNSPEMQKIYHLIKKISKTNTSVLIEGESGTGKSLVGQVIHQSSQRSDKPFRSINCSAIEGDSIKDELMGTDGKKGLLSCDGECTVILDQVNNIGANLQAALLNVVEEQNDETKTNLRLIAASSKPVKDLVKAGLFREDLYYRLNVIPIILPPLRRRVEDIPALISHFLKKEEEKVGTTLSISDDAQDCLLHYSWPGNIRELENVISCAALISETGVITCGELPPNITDTERDTLSEVDNITDERSLKTFLRNKEKNFINTVLLTTNGNRVKAAKILGISRASLYRKLED